MGETGHVEEVQPVGQRSSATPTITAAIILGLAAIALIVWYVSQRESPSIVVQRFCSAVKGARWEQAYEMIDWPEDRKVDEKTFVSTARALQPLFTVEKYILGEPKREGDVATVPVTVTIAKTGLTGTQDVTKLVPIECRFKNGAWKVRPVLKDLLGAGSVSIPGQQ